MGKTARAVHWTGHRHSARVPCPGAAGCVTLRFVRGFSSAVYAAGKDDPTVSAGGRNQEGGHPLFGVFPALRRDGGPGQLPASVGDTRNPACRGAALAADSRERTAPIKPAYGISMNAIPGREHFRRIIGQNCQPVILVLDKKLSKLFIAPQARQELMRRLLRQTAAKGRR